MTSDLKSVCSLARGAPRGGAFDPAGAPRGVPGNRARRLKLWVVSRTVLSFSTLILCLAGQLGFERWAKFLTASRGLGVRSYGWH